MSTDRSDRRGAGAEPGPRPDAEGRPPLWPLWGAALVALLAVVTLALRFTGGPSVEGVETAEAALMRVAVISFEALSVEDGTPEDGTPEDRTPDAQGTGGDAGDLRGAVAAGLTEVILARLSAVGSLRVEARRGASGGTPSQDVDAVLRGSVLWDPAATPQRLEILVELTGPGNNGRPWSESFGRGTDDVGSVPARLVARVLEQLGVEPTDSERRILEGRTTSNPEAFLAYLRGEGLAGRLDPRAETLAAATDELQRAVDLDPDFAAAHARLSEVHSQMYQQGVDRSEEHRGAAEAAAGRSLALAPELALAHRASGFYQARCRQEHDLALRAFARAVSRSGGDPRALAGMGDVRRRQGRYDEALVKLRQALDHDPENPRLALELAGTLGFLRRYREADRYYDQAIRLAPSMGAGYRARASNHILWTGDLQGARSILEEMPEETGATSTLAWFRLELMAGRPRLALALLDAAAEDLSAAAGMPEAYLRAVALRLAGESAAAEIEAERARRTLERQFASQPEDPRIHGAAGLVWAELGNEDRALHHSRRAVDLASALADDPLELEMREHLAAAHARLGQTAEALELLSRLLSVPAEISAESLRVDPRWALLQDDPEFLGLLMLQGAQG